MGDSTNPRGIQVGSKVRYNGLDAIVKEKIIGRYLLTLADGSSVSAYESDLILAEDDTTKVLMDTEDYKKEKDLP